MSKKENKHTLLKVIGVTAAAGAVAYGGAGYYAFTKFFDLSKSAIYRSDNLLPHRNHEINEWLLHSEQSDEFIDSFDGLKLHATVFHNHPDSHKWMILMHEAGYSWQSLLDMIYEADHRDFNVVACDERGCGMSEGKYTTLGWSEHYDLLSWINSIIRKDAESEIVLFGQGIGGSAVMNACGDFVPGNVKIAVEEGGASGIRELVSYGITKLFKTDAKLLLPSIDLFVKQFLHFSMNDVSTKHQLQNAHLPVMFVHGSEDKIVPASMVFDNFYSCASVKDILIADGAEHMECSKDPDYFNRIFTFIDTYMNC